MASAIFLAAVLAGGIWVVLVPPSAPPAGGQQAAPLAPAEAVDPLPSPVSDCAPQAAAEVAPEQMLTQVYLSSWYPVGTMSAPNSATGGPLDARRCFTRTPEGALYAAVTRIAEEAAQAGLVGTDFNGYQWRSFTPDQAVLAVQVRRVTTLDTRLIAMIFVATWSGNDWQVVPDASAGAIKSASDPLRTFTPWGNNS